MDTEIENRQSLLYVPYVLQLHYLRALLVVIGAFDAHPMKVRRRGHHGAANPRGIFALGRRGDPDLRAG